MDVIVNGSEINGTVKVPASKSIAHRILIASALSDKETIVNGVLLGEDVTATMNALTALGAKFEKIASDKMKITPISNLPVEQVEIDAKESGSTLRFMLPLVSALGVSARFDGEGRLPFRPIETMIDVLENHGVEVNSRRIPLELRNKLQSGKFVIGGVVSSQYVTGLLFALPLLDGDSVVEVVGTVASKSYIELTLDVLKDFGIVIEKEGNSFFIKGGQKFVSKGEYTVEGDWSSASFFAVLGAIAGKVTIEGMKMDSTQGDRVVLNILEKMGAKIIREENRVTIEKSKLSAVTMSAMDCPDIIPVLVVAMAVANGVSTIYDVERLKFKECDRLEAIMIMLKKAGIKMFFFDDTLQIRGGKPQNLTMYGENDHRIVMSLAVLGSVCQKVKILSVGCVKKSYPKFFEDFLKVGGKYENSL